jgi:predicted nucleic acid-binding protein
MEMKKYLLDSNAVIDYIGGILPQKSIEWLDSIIETAVSMSVINRIEALGFNPPNPADLLPFEDLVNTVEVIGLPEEIIQQTIDVRKNYKIKLPDAVVAATSLVLGLTVISKNTADFGKVQGITLINPHDLK